MAWNKTDRSFKILANRRVTDAEPAKYWYNEKSDTTIDIHASDIKLDTIPGTPPVADTSVVDVYNYSNRLTLIEDTSVPGQMTWFATTNSTTSAAQTDEASRLKDWISEKYGADYAIQVYDSSDVQVPYSDASNWYFDYQTGILTFANANTDSGSVSSRAPYKIVGYRYIGKKGADAITLTANADGFSISGGTTPRTLSLISGNITLTSGNNNPNITIPNVASQTSVANTSSFTQYGIVFSSSAVNGVVASTGQGASGQPLIGQGASNPVFGNIDIANYATGILGVSHGGSGTNTTFTQGSIILAGSSGVYTQDNGNLFWDSTNHTMGVGTTRSGAISGTNPSLRVKGTGTTSSTSSFEVQDSAAATLFFVRDDGLIRLGTKGVYTESTGLLQAQSMLVENNQAYKSKDSVGASTDMIYIDSSDNFRFNVQAAKSYQWGINGTEFMRLNATGLGINNTNPATTLAVGGAGGSNASFEIAVSSSITMQAYNRNIFDYASFNIDGALINFRISGVAAMGIAAVTRTTTFSPASTKPAINLGNSGTVGSPSTGDLWWDSGAVALNFRTASATINLLSDAVTVGTTTVNSGTTGSILFVGGSSLLQQDNSNLFWDDTNNTMGVGTTRAGAVSGTNPVLRVKGTGTTSSTSSFEVQNSSSATLFFVRDDGLTTVGGACVVTKNVTSGVVTLTDGATPALDASLGNTFILTASGDRTIAVPTNPTSGQRILIVHKANGADRTLALNTGTGGFRFGTTIASLSITVNTKTDYIEAVYNSADDFWDVIAYVKGL